jgi:hypothetical protein
MIGWFTIQLSAVALPPQLAPHESASIPALFSTLFSLTHGYARDVPLSRLFEYQRGLCAVLSSVRAPSSVEVAGHHTSLLSAALHAAPVEPLFSLPPPVTSTANVSNVCAYAAYVVW